MDIYTVVSDVIVVSGQTSALVQFSHDSTSSPRLRILNFSVSLNSIPNEELTYLVALQEYSASSINDATTLQLNPLMEWSPYPSVTAESIVDSSDAEFVSALDRFPVIGSSPQFIYKQYEYWSEPISSYTAPLAIVAYNSSSDNANLVTTVTFGI